jgi:hypothetical protein
MVLEDILASDLEPTCLPFRPVEADAREARPRRPTLCYLPFAESSPGPCRWVTWIRRCCVGNGPRATEDVDEYSAVSGGGCGCENVRWSWSTRASDVWRRLAKYSCHHQIRCLVMNLIPADLPGGRRTRWRDAPFQFRQSASAWPQPLAMVAASPSQSSPTCPS